MHRSRIYSKGFRPVAPPPHSTDLHTAAGPIRDQLAPLMAPLGHTAGDRDRRHRHSAHSQRQRRLTERRTHGARGMLEGILCTSWVRLSQTLLARDRGPHLAAIRFDRPGSQTEIARGRESERRLETRVGDFAEVADPPAGFVVIVSGSPRRGEEDQRIGDRLAERRLRPRRRGRGRGDPDPWAVDQSRNGDPIRFLDVLEPACGPLETLRLHRVASYSVSVTLSGIIDGVRAG